MTDSVVVTGIGIVSAAGVGLAEFERKLFAGECAVANGTLKREAGEFQLQVGTVQDDPLPDCVQPLKHLNFKHMSRSGLMVCAAAGLAIRDSQCDPAHQSLEQTGIVMGTAFGGMQSMLRFNADVRAKGPAAVNPIIFPDTVSNAPAGYAAIAFGMLGMNATLSTGFASGLRALRVAYEHLLAGGLNAVLAGGYDELIPDLCYHWHSSGATFVPGEAAVALVLERKSSALERKAPIYGELLGFGSCQSHSAGNSKDSRTCTMQRALRDAGVDAGQVKAVFLSANGSEAADASEAEATADLFGPAIFRMAVKQCTGECMAAAGPASLVAALLALRRGDIPGGGICLINSFGLDGQGESAVVRSLQAT